MENERLFAKELHETFTLTVDVSDDSEEIHKIVWKITDFEQNTLKEGPFDYDFADFAEVLSEGIHLLLSGVTKFNIKKAENSKKTLVKV